MPRHKEFDPAEALASATKLFQAKGYHNCSMRDLIAATGVNQYGLYSHFGDKRGMLIAALDHYERQATQPFLVALQAPGAFDRVFTSAMSVLLEAMETEYGVCGCLMAGMSAEMAPEDDEIRQRVGDHFRLMKSHLKTRLQVAAAGSGGPGDEGLEMQAELLTCFVYSANQQTRLGARHEDILSRAQALAQALVLPQES